MPLKAEITHQLHDALGRRFGCFGAGNMVDGVAAFAGQHYIVSRAGCPATRITVY